MKRLLISLLSLTVLLTTSETYSKENSSTFQLPEPTSTLININNLAMWIREDGLSGTVAKADTSEFGISTKWFAGIFFPRGKAGVVTHDGIVWGGLVNDGHSPQLRVGGQTFRSGLVSGRIISKGVAEDPNDPGVRIWRIRSDWQSADLTRDAAEFFGVPVDSVTQEQIHAVRTQYEQDWNTWPWQKGAPFYDNNQNGIMDRGEEPGLAGADQVVWFVANDLSFDATTSLYGSPPIGLEMQGTLWAYKERDFYGTKILANTIFKRYRLIYKGTDTTANTAHIDDMYLAQWSNPDVGDPTDDFVGCDTTLQLGFAYNSNSIDEVYYDLGLAPPAIGYTLIQGPLVANQNPQNQTKFKFRTRKGFRNLPMFAFAGFGQGLEPNPILGLFEGTIEWWNLLRGFSNQCLPCLPPRPFPPQPVPLCGDPLAGQGDIDGIIAPPGERRFMFSTGPFTMTLGDTQEVIIALVAGLGADRLFSVQVMKYYAKWARLAYKYNFELPTSVESPPAEAAPTLFRLYQNFPNPFNPGTEIRYDLPAEKHVTLTIYNLLGQKVKTLVDETQKAGSYWVSWNGTDEHGTHVPSGVYLYRLQVGHVSGLRKMLVVR